MKILKNIKNNRATTLIEIVLYFTILTAFLFSAMTFAIQISNNNFISSNRTEIQSNLDLITRQFTQSIQGATSINESNSEFDISPGELSLNMNNSSISPTHFYLTDGDLFMQQGSQAAIQLNSNILEFTSLQFTRITYDKAPDHIIIDGVVQIEGSNNASSSQATVFHLAISLRNL